MKFYRYVFDKLFVGTSVKFKHAHAFNLDAYLWLCTQYSRWTAVFFFSLSFFISSVPEILDRRSGDGGGRTYNVERNVFICARHSMRSMDQWFFPHQFWSNSCKNIRQIGILEDSKKFSKIIFPKTIILHLIRRRNQFFSYFFRAFDKKNYHPYCYEI